MILLVTGLLLFLFGCEHGAIPAEMLAKTPWYQKQLKLIRENNADQIQAPLAKQGIAVGRIIQKFSDNTLQVNGNVPFGNSSIRFSDADSAAKISEGDWIVARVMRDPKGRPPLIQDYRKVSVNTDSIPEEFYPECEKLICLGIEQGWNLKIELSGMNSTTISLPFISMTADGPQHLDVNLTKQKFEAMTAVELGDDADDANVNENLTRRDPSDYDVQLFGNENENTEK